MNCNFKCSRFSNLSNVFQICQSPNLSVEIVDSGVKVLRPDRDKFVALDGAALRPAARFAFADASAAQS